jgi:predicted nucleotidyltransferase
LFQDEEQITRIDSLRQRALEIMNIVQRFNPYLTGSVLDGTAGRYAEIDIQLFTDSAKDVEIFLLNQQIDYEHSVPRSDRAEAVLTILSDDATTNLIVYPRKEERVAFKTRDGRVRARIRLETLESLLAASRAPTP